MGYFDRLGNMELAIAIRTLLKNDERLSVQAGAGIVFDSRPAAEYEETVNKARALFAFSTAKSLSDWTMRNAFAGSASAGAPPIGVGIA